MFPAEIWLRKKKEDQGSVMEASLLEWVTAAAKERAPRPRQPARAVGQNMIPASLLDVGATTSDKTYLITP